VKRFRMAPIYVALFAVSILFLFPFYWVIVSSLKSVAGMNLVPPSFYPSEQLSVKLSLPASHEIFESDGADWLLLAKSPDLLGGSSDPGAYYLQLNGPKPSELAAWIPNSAVKIQNKSYRDIPFDSVPINDIGGKRVAVLAKMVRQKSNGFDELLFTSTSGAGAFRGLQIRENVPHHEIRYFSAHFDNYTKALKGPEASIGGRSTGFLLFMRNSLFIAGMAVLGQILSSSLVAFGFSRMHFKGREALFIVLLATLMVPAQVTLIPLFTIYKSIGWVDSFLPLIVPQFTAGAFNVFLIRQFMLGFPKELDESAELDGATPWRIYRNIIFPNCGPVLIVVGLFTFIAAWQDVLGPLIYLDNPNYRTVSLGLEYFRSPYVDNRPLLMAGAVLSMLPVAALFIVAQRYIMSGIVTTGLK
jgi:multiple sugar transport system permease protein